MKRAWLLGVLVLAGCATRLAPDLERLYLSSGAAPHQPPVILIPGVMGSRLVDADGVEHWPGKGLRPLLAARDGLALAVDPRTLEPMDDDLVARGLTDRVAGRDYYASIIRVLETAGRYQRGVPGTRAEPGRRYFYEFPYDWRHDNLRAVAALDQLIEQIRIDHDDPDLQVDIIAHSMGGLVARYYMRYGPTDVLESNDFPLTYRGEGRVRRLALLGTPNLGSVSSLHAFIVGERVGLRRIQPEVMATFPSLYQLFPHPLNDWVLSHEGEPLRRDVFDIEIWRRFEWSIFDPQVRQRIRGSFESDAEADAHLAVLEAAFYRKLERARRFVWSLTIPLDRVPWTMATFGGDCHLTPARIVVEEVRGESVVRLRPRDIRAPMPGVDYDRLMLEPGDQRVTKASLLARETLDPAVPRHPYSFFPVAGSIFLCEGHDRLATNINFQDNLLQFLLSKD
ncbi:MAG: lipase/acyltransferase domain-containing protein [Gammaproteobacteria bacterium]